MHGSAGLHSAMAIKRQRRIREQARKRERERRLSSRTDSIDSVDTHDHDQMPHRYTHHAPPRDHALATSIGMLHLGVCFLVLGMFLIGSGLLPDDIVTWRGVGWFNELVITGIFVLALGIFLIALNRVMSRREEDELQDYVQRQLTRSRSGHRLERDLETGCLTTKNHRRMMEKKREEMGRLQDAPVGVHSPHNKNAPNTVLNSAPINGGDQLEKILEEDVFIENRLDENRPTKETSVSNTTTASLASPGSPSMESRELLINGRQHSFNSRQY